MISITVGSFSGVSVDDHGFRSHVEQPILDWPLYWVFLGEP